MLCNDTISCKVFHCAIFSVLLVPSLTAKVLSVERVNVITKHNLAQILHPVNNYLNSYLIEAIIHYVEYLRQYIHSGNMSSFLQNCYLPLNNYEE